MMHLSNIYGLLWCWMLLQDNFFSPCNCRSCENSCLTCESENHCRQCKHGFWGDACNETCKSYCNNNTCSRHSGLCDSCEDGKFLNPEYFYSLGFAAITVVLLSVMVTAGVCYRIRRQKSSQQPPVRSKESESLIQTNGTNIDESNKDDPEYETVYSVPLPDDPPQKGRTPAPLQLYGQRLGAYCINDFNGKRAYVACKDPKSLDDKIEFWKMIWKERCKIIVMLTGPQEDAESNMHWTDVTKEKQGLCYGKLCVTTDGHTLHEGNICRSIEVEKELEKRTVIQIQWQFSCLPSMENLCLFRNLVLKHTETSQCVPLLIHSSDGVSRCGLYMALDIFLKRRESGYFKPIAACICHLRNQNSALLRHNEEKQLLKNADKLLFERKSKH